MRAATRSVHLTLRGGVRIALYVHRPRAFLTSGSVERSGVVIVDMGVSSIALLSKTAC